MAKTGWDRSKGTSKREQGILTPPQPRRMHCGCWYIGKQLFEMCRVHQDGLSNIMQQLQDVAIKQREALEKEKTPEAAKSLEAAIENAEVKNL